MTRIIFVSADGERRQEVDAAPGSVLLDVAQAAGWSVLSVARTRHGCASTLCILQAVRPTHTAAQNWADRHTVTV